MSENIIKQELQIQDLTPEGMYQFFLSEMKKIEDGTRPVPKAAHVAARLHLPKENFWAKDENNERAKLMDGSDPDEIHAEPWAQALSRSIMDRKKAVKQPEEKYIRIFDCLDVSEEEFNAMKCIAQIAKDPSYVQRFPLEGASVWFKLHNIDNPAPAENENDFRSDQCLIVYINKTKYFALTADGQFALQKGTGWKRFVYYGRDALYSGYDQRHEQEPLDYEWTPSGYRLSVRGLWPTSMKDLFECTQCGANAVVDLIMDYFSQVNPFWNDLRKDFAAGSAYSAMDCREIWEAHSRQHLIQMKFGTSLNRNNKEPIGHGIFLARASKMVKENEMQKLYGYNPGQVYLSRKKEDMLEPLSDFIYNNCPGLDKPFKLPHDREIIVGKQIIRDALNMDVQMRRKSSLTYHSARAIYEWHEHCALTIRSRELPTVRISRDSKFRELKMPKNCVRLKSKKEFLEEAEFQNNCVASYIEDVNADMVSIWSMRKDDGTRVTIEVRWHGGDYRRGGYFYVNQMAEYGNSDCSKEDYDAVRKCLEGQTIPENSRGNNPYFREPHRFYAYELGQ